MNSVLSVLRLIAAFLGFSFSVPNLVPQEISLSWKAGDKNALIVLAYVNISVLSKSLITAVVALIESHEKVVSVEIQDNKILVTVVI